MFSAHMAAKQVAGSAYAATGTGPNTRTMPHGKKIYGKSENHAGSRRGGRHSPTSQPQSPNTPSSPFRDMYFLKHVDILAAVESLYIDRLKPWGRILRKRLLELHMARLCVDKEQGQNAQSLLHHIFRQTEKLEAVCRKNSRLHVFADEVAEGGDWWAEIIGQSCDFVNAQSPVDVYPEEMWFAASEFFCNPKNQELALPRSRYDCALALVAMELPFLQGLTLGEVCHIVQLCISQKKLLGQRKGALVPYEQSDSRAKELRAAEGIADEDCDESSPVATWGQLAEGLQDILSHQDYIPLATLKQHFNGSQVTKLSETALGYSKLSELVQDERLKDICRLQLDNKGYFVVPAEENKNVRVTPKQPSPPGLPAKAAPSWDTNVLATWLSLMGRSEQHSHSQQPMKIPFQEDLNTIGAYPGMGLEVIQKPLIKPELSYGDTLQDQFPARIGMMPPWSSFTLPPDVRVMNL
mmetsp:Transcript_63140/g.150531  ORF Transcript_63140/g.150531 Transcript_63140/m.150531 type:complete len:467 (+) Transcript_63140:128-1528(+)